MNCYWVIKHFKGGEYLDLLFIDDARQVRRAAKKLGVSWDHSQAGVPRSNTITDTLVGSICDAIRACSVTAGLPACFWQYLGAHICLLRNVFIDDDGESAYYQRFAEHFAGLAIPPGALVWLHLAVSK